MSTENKFVVSSYEPTLQRVHIENINFGRKAGVDDLNQFTTNNVRDVEKNFDFSKGADKQLLDSIRMEGLKDPLMLMEVKGKKPVVLKGNRRGKAIEILYSEADKAAYNAHFADGILCMVYPPLPDDVKWSLICDHQYMKKLSPLEQYYTVLKLIRMDWSLQDITTRVTGSMGFTNKCSRIAKLARCEDNYGLKLYNAITDKLKGVEGAKTVADSVIMAMTQAVSSGKYEGKNEIFNGKTSEEIYTIWEAGDDKAIPMRSKAEIEKRVSVETNEEVVEALKWVLGLVEWEVEPAN